MTTKITKSEVEFRLHHLGYEGDETTPGERYSLRANWEGDVDEISHCWPTMAEVEEASGIKMRLVDQGDDLLEAILEVL